MIYGDTKFTLADFQALIRQQLQHNQNKSLFYESRNGQLALSPSNEISKTLIQRANDISDFILSSYRDGTWQQLIKYTADRTMNLFMEVNQFLNFSAQKHHELREIYADLLEHVYVMGHKKEVFPEYVERLLNSHYKKLQQFLLESNGYEIFKKYRRSPNILEIKCANYTTEFQIKLLGIDLSTVKQPLLDIGCGKQASLVTFLRDSGIESYGIDRNAQSINGVDQVNWFDYTFLPNTWGTIISHMAFSNHFTHHHLSPDGEYKIYAEKYMEIVKALKSGGSFIYAPGLPFIEEVLSNANIGFIVNTTSNATKVTRIN